jgi:pilus assembly protein CpaF
MFELILPHIQPIRHLITDTSISEVMVNDDGRVFIDKRGRLFPIEVAMTPGRLRDAITNIARVLDQDINADRPTLHARLPDGSRVCAMVPPASLRGPVLSIRKFLPKTLTTGELVDCGSLPSAVLTRLLAGIHEQENILISGGTNAGKTTLLNALFEHIPAHERIVVIEETAEVKLERHANVVRTEAQQAQPGREAVTVRHLLETALRLRPDRIIVGEVRGATAYDLLQAMNTGHAGTLTTLHANSAVLALHRFASMALRAETNSDHQAIRAEIAEVVHLVIQTKHDKATGRRFVSELVEVEGYRYQEDRFSTRLLYPEEKETV